MKPLAHLFSPLKIKNMELTNRCVLPPMGTGLGNRDGSVSEATLAYINRRARSGVGLVITEIAGVHPTGTVGISAAGDEFIPGLKKMADVIHQAGAKGALQLHHAGREAFYQLSKGMALGPSAIPSLVYGMAPKEMTPEDINEIIVSFGLAAKRAREADFDAVELHGAHGYLLAQFLSAISNQRTDEYGGSFKNRARFVMEIVREVRRNVGNDFPILLRISAEEYIKGGFTVEDVQTIIPDLVSAGVDVIHASVGTHGSPGGITSAPPEFEEGWNTWRAKKLKEVTEVPVIAVGRFSDPGIADDVIARGDADLVAFGRQILADPDFLIKASEGRPDDILKCLACNQGCIERLIFRQGSIRCAINPETGQELIYPGKLTGESKKVWVIGMGPAGLTAAAEAARLGHRVTVFDKEEEAGGQIRFASKAPEKDLYAGWISWLTRQVETNGAQVRAGVEVTPEMLDSSGVDAVILATGGEAMVPEIEGLEQPLVCEATRVLGGQIPPGKNAAVIGGGLVGMETADFLAARGSKVTIIEMLKSSPVLKASGHGYMLHKRLSESGCTFLFNTRVKRITGSSIITISEDGTEKTLPVDQVVVAVGMKPVQALQGALEEKGIRHFVVGDANQVRRIIEATEEGARAAWEV